MTKKPLPKLIVPDAQCCEMMDNKGRRCTRRHVYQMVRADCTTMRLCRTDAYKLRDQIQHYPDTFATVRFVAINKYTPVE